MEEEKESLLRLTRSCGKEENPTSGKGIFFRHDLGLKTATFSDSDRTYRLHVHVWKV